MKLDLRIGDGTLPEEARQRPERNGDPPHHARA